MNKKKFLIGILTLSSLVYASLELGVIKWVNDNGGYSSLDFLNSSIRDQIFSQEFVSEESITSDGINAKFNAVEEEALNLRGRVETLENNSAGGSSNEGVWLSRRTGFSELASDLPNGTSSNGCEEIFMDGVLESDGTAFVTEPTSQFYALIYPVPSPSSYMGNAGTVAGCSGTANYSLNEGDRLIFKIYYEVPQDSTIQDLFINLYVIDSNGNGYENEFVFIKEGNPYPKGLNSSNYQDPPYDKIDRAIIPGETGVMYTIVDIENRDNSSPVNINDHYLFEIIASGNTTDNSNKTFRIYGYEIEKL